ncbi:NAD-dependent epimerase/dehydratase family protein [Halioglobus maricola]|uniref:NAD-dependent epimerase/dehydratase family protein n=1 Tax=Halioglobus maricola TaxID=2601894 RepID=A0A5P9NNE0_9GAMM|nr:SDR family oxidoreductase [Halioglobus maricola]QFU77282.1 NAD-dependent epimerase/dehydratase family protein [Halioglobus maricola]
MAKVLITGATGFIGNHVTRLCLERGYEVRAMVMPGEDRSPLDGFEVEFVEGNLLDPASLERAVQGVEKVFHLAALFAIWTKDPDLHYKINVNGTESLMRAALAAGVEKVVYTSSVAAIGIPENGAKADETTPFNSWPWASEYILSKYLSHQLVKGLVSEGLPVTMVMPGLPFGPGDRMPTPTGTMIIRTLQGKMKNYWDGGVCPVDVRDVAAGHVLAMEKGRVGESYILANREGNMANQDFLQMIGRIAGVDNVATTEVSGKMMLRVAKLAELWTSITGKAPMTTVKNTRYILQHGYVNPTKAIEELGLPQTPIETAVRDSVEWFRANGYV